MKDQNWAEKTYKEILGEKINKIIMTKIEKEIKIKITNPQEVFQILQKMGAQVLNKSKEITTRFDTREKSLEKAGLFLRVRSGSKNTITLKEKTAKDKLVKARKETEFEIQDIEKMAYILKRLGFDYIRIMEKFRINLKYKRAKLSIDELPFGFYLEIEGKEEQINNILKELGYREKDRIIETYWDIFKKYKEKNNITQQNIVFEKNYISKILNIK